MEQSLTPPTLAELAEELCVRHGCHTVILYGSRARGQHGPESDVDLMGIRTSEGDTRDARLWRGVYLDAFIYQEASLEVEPDPGLLRIREGVVLKERDGYATNLIERVRALYERGPAPLPPAELTADLAWTEKMLTRIKPTSPRDLAAHFRRASLLTQMLELYFKLRTRWYLGPKESFAWLEHNDPPAWQAFADALEPGASYEAIERLARLVVCVRPQGA